MCVLSVLVFKRRKNAANQERKFMKSPEDTLLEHDGSVNIEEQNSQIQTLPMEETGNNQHPLIVLKSNNDVDEDSKGSSGNGFFFLKTRKIMLKARKMMCMSVKI